MKNFQLKTLACFLMFAIIFAACEQDVLTPNPTSIIPNKTLNDSSLKPSHQGSNIPHVCTTHGDAEQLRKHYPGYDENHPAKIKMKEIYKNSANSGNLKSGQTYTIPIVFHALWFSDQGTIYGDIQQSQIDRAMEILNADFSQTNDQSFIPQNFLNIADNPQIEFVLAEKDPDGVCLTEAGINRIQSNFVFDGSQHIPCGGSFGYYMRDNFHWDTDKYLNIYLVDYIALDDDGNCVADPNSSGSGYALLPADAAQYPNLDGIVLNYHYLGDIGEAVGNDFPSTISHEAGHWLGLNHTWGSGAFGVCGNDGIADTPQTSGNYSNDFPNYCMTGANNTCGSNDNVHNFMDYACESMFTQGQVGAMCGVLESSIADRDNVWSASNLSEVMGCNGGQPECDNDPVFSQYPLASSYVDENNCTSEQITVYNKWNIDWLFIETPTSSKLYRTDTGQLWCTNSASTDCLAYYGMTNQIAEWECCD